MTVSGLLNLLSLTRVFFLVCVSVCNFVVHDRCMKTVVSPCSSIATSLIKVCILHLQSVYLRAQELCESRGGCPGPPVPDTVIVLMVPVDVKQH